MKNLKVIIINLVKTAQTINYKQAKENAWVHLSCACWIPEVEFADFNKKEDIKSKIFLNRNRFN